MSGRRYRIDPSFDGSYSVRPDYGDAIARGAGSAVGWLVGAGASGAMNAAHGIKDRRMQSAADELGTALDNDDYDLLLNLASNFSKRYPAHPYGHFYAGLALIMRQQFEAADAAIYQAAQLGFDNPEMHSMLAMAYEEVGNKGKAIQEYTIVAQSPQDRPSALYNRAHILLDLGDFDQALRDANESIAALPGATGYCVRAHIHRSRGDLEAAVQDYSRAVNLAPDIAAHRENRAEVYEALGRPIDAQKDREAAHWINGQIADQQNNQRATEASSPTIHTPTVVVLGVVSILAFLILVAAAANGSPLLVLLMLLLMGGTIAGVVVSCRGVRP